MGNKIDRIPPIFNVHFPGIAGSPLSGDRLCRVGVFLLTLRAGVVAMDDRLPDVLPRINVLTQEQIEHIHAQSSQILASVGIRVDSHIDKNSICRKLTGFFAIYILQDNFLYLFNSFFASYNFQNTRIEH